MGWHRKAELLNSVNGHLPCGDCLCQSSPLIATEEKEFGMLIARYFLTVFWEGRGRSGRAVHVRTHTPLGIHSSVPSFKLRSPGREIMLPFNNPNQKKEKNQF